MCDSHVTGASTHLQSEFKLTSTQSHLEVKGHTITVQILKYIVRSYNSTESSQVSCTDMSSVPV